MKKKNLILVSLMLVLIIVLVLYLYFENTSKTTNKTTQANTGNIEINYDSSYLENSQGEYIAKINLSDNNTTITGKGATVENNTITITKAGTYYITGKLSDGNIVINCKEDGDVQLVLDNVNITSKTTAPINGIKAENLVITLADNSVNYLTDSEQYTEFTDTEKQEPDGTLFTKTDLVINGNGKLAIDSNYQDGIVSKDTLKIMNAEIEIDSADDGIRGKDFVEISNANITINAVKKGIRSTNTKDSSLGYVAIESGNININKSYEGIEARYIQIDGGTINITASDDGINASDGSSQQGFMGQQTNSNVGIEINGGDITINASGDGIDSNGSVYINGGNTVVAGPTSNGDSPLDYDGECIMTGGSLICYGSTGMWQSIGTNSTVNEAVFYNSGNSGDKISIKDSNGNEIANFETVKNYSGIGIASSDIKNGETYTLYVNDQEVASITANGTVTANGNSQNGMNGGNPRGGMEIPGKEMGDGPKDDMKDNSGEGMRDGQENNFRKEMKNGQENDMENMPDMNEKM